jgi:hypothetical protein
LHLSPVDLEFAALAGCDDDTAWGLAGELDLEAETCRELEISLRRRKAAYLRASLAELILWSDLSADTIQILSTWLSQVMPQHEAEGVVATQA